MKLKVLFIGSIGAVSETSELQRKAYNQAMAENGLDWEWDQDIYRDLLKSNGGKDRLRQLSAATHKNLPEELIERIHARKTEIACQMVVDHAISPRPGVTGLIREAKNAGVKVAWITTTGIENTDAILEAAGSQLSSSDFDHIFHREDAPQGKPSPAIYNFALKHYGVNASSCVAVEDSLNSALSAKGAGIFTVVTPGKYHDEHLENIADIVIPSLESLEWRRLLEKYLETKKSPILE